MSPARSIDGQAVLVTGAARGIGAATARALAARGARVSLVGLEPDRLAALAAELGDGHAWFEADVTEQASVDAAVAGTVGRFGGIDVVIANAGVANYGTVHTAEVEAFARTIDVNLTGVYRTVAAAAPHVVRRRGYVLLVASIASFTPLPGAAAYAASKAGVESLAGALRTELAVSGVTVGSVHPSWIDTDMVRDAEAALPSFRRLRASLPWPARATTSVEDCAEALTDAVARRARRAFVPRSGRVVAAVRPLLASPLGQALVFRDAPRFVPALDQEVRELSASAAVPRT